MEDRYCAGIIFPRADARDAEFWGLVWADKWAARKSGRWSELVRSTIDGRSPRIGIALIAPLSEATE